MSEYDMLTQGAPLPEGPLPGFVIHNSVDFTESGELTITSDGKTHSKTPAEWVRLAEMADLSLPAFEGFPENEPAPERAKRLELRLHCANTIIQKQELETANLNTQLDNAYRMLYGDNYAPLEAPAAE